MTPNSSIDQEISAENHRGMTILRSTGRKPFRRVFYLNSYGMANAWRQYRDGTHPGQHLWGCLELLRMGYEVAMPDERNQSGPFFNYRRQDLKYVEFARGWLGRDGIVYSGHTILFWTPLLSRLRIIRCPVVSMLYARGENLRFAGGYKGVLALTPAAADRARALAPNAQIAHVRWGVDMPFFPVLPYNPRWFLSCGKTRRDFPTLKAAAAHPAPIHVINTRLPSGIDWPSNVRQFTGGSKGDWLTVSFRDLIHEHYAGCAASLILLQADPAQRYAAGFTQLLEAMALARPVIVTGTGALADELDVEREGCGIAVPPEDPAAIIAAMKAISDDPARAEAMGINGRRLCETRYNINRYGADLHRFFESL
jgi:hypothetical protein